MGLMQNWQRQEVDLSSRSHVFAHTGFIGGLIALDRVFGLFMHEAAPGARCGQSVVIRGMACIPYLWDKN